MGLGISESVLSLIDRLSCRPVGLDVCAANRALTTQFPKRWNCVGDAVLQVARPKAFVLEDEPIIAMDIEDTLRGLGFDVSIVADPTKR